jgi:hypothetical protein
MPYFIDTLTVAYAGGVYTLQAYVTVGGVNQWVDITTVAGTGTGTVSANVQINTAIYQVGLSYDFRWIDQIGNTSDVITMTIPDCNVTMRTEDGQTIITEQGQGIKL